MLESSLRKMRAIFMRDARLAYAYVIAFWTDWAGVVGQAVTFYFVSKMIGASPTFSYNGKPLPYYDYVAVNLAFLRFQNAAMSSFQRAIRNEQYLGTMESILVTPTDLSLLIVSSGLWPFALTTLQIVIFFAVAVPLGLDLSHVNLATALAFIVLTLLAFSPLGILTAASIMSFKQGLPTGLLVGGVASLFGGVFFPVSKLPPVLQKVAWLFPVTHSLNGIRAAVAGATLDRVGGDALWLSAMALVLLPLSLFAFARSVRRAKVDGTLGDY